MGQEETKLYETDIYFSRLEEFKNNSIPSNSIVYLGNSLIQNGKWDTYYGDIKPYNRGIIGNNTEGMLQILPEILASHPSKLFFIGGINDISQDKSNKEILQNIKEIIALFQASSPTTQIYLHSLLPINNSFGRYKRLKGKEKQIIKFNKELKKLAKDKGLVLIDLYPHFLGDDKKNLNPNFTRDGLHLTAEAYKIWADLDRKYIEE